MTYQPRYYLEDFPPVWEQIKGDPAALSSLSSRDQRVLVACIELLRMYGLALLGPGDRDATRMIHEWAQSITPEDTTDD